MRRASLFCTVLTLVLTVTGFQSQSTRKAPTNSSPQSPARRRKGQNTGNQVTAKQAGTLASDDKKATEAALLKLTISTSRREVTLTGAYGIFADIQNVGSTPVVLYPSEVVLAVQPEVTQTAACVYEVNGYFPTEASAGSPPSPENTTAQGAESRQAKSGGSPESGANVSEQPSPVEKINSIQIRPNEHYTVFWDVNRANTSGCQVEVSWWDSLGFVPGEYSFTIDGKAHSVTDSGEEKDYHTFTQTTLLRVGISQIVVMWAAMVGAILAYVVVALQKQGDFQRLQTAGAGEKLTSVFVILRNIVSAALLGAAITIVSSRLADTQFPVKVSVNDVWGALAIGFVAFFVGNKFIEKLAKL